jgi:hyperosmotically inducible protein
MRVSKILKGLVVVVAVGTFAGGCSNGSSKSPEVSDTIRKDLDQSHYGDVTVKQDRDKGVVTLGGHVLSDGDKLQAEGIAKNDAAGQVVADEISVEPPEAGHDVTAVNSDLDKAIEKNLDAALIENKFDKDITHEVKNGVVTLKGEVNSEARRSRVQAIASKVPNVQQVVNELEVKNQKASSSK